MPMQRLREEGHTVTGLFFNPNIHPLQEYLRRRTALLEAAARLDLPLILLDKEYDPQRWFREVTLREPSRCRICHALRLEKTRSVAKRGGFDAFSTTLLYSRQQQHESLAALGRDLAGQGAPVFLYRDFRPCWEQGIALSQSWGLYRQSYCGCLYSEFERYQRELREPQPPGQRD